MKPQLNRYRLFKKECHECMIYGPGEIRKWVRCYRMKDASVVFQTIMDFINVK